MARATKTFEIILVNDDGGREVRERVYGWEDAVGPSDLLIQSLEVTCVGQIMVREDEFNNETNRRTSGLNHAFQDTQNGVTFDSWSLQGTNVDLNDVGRQRIAAQRGLGLRSTMIGDIFHDTSCGLSDGYWMVVPFGWQELRYDPSRSAFVCTG